MNWSSERLQEAWVMVVGCGALGNEVMKNLVLMGVGHFVLVDFDYVEPSNLSRSILYRRSDVGKRKVDVAKQALLQLNSNLQVDTIFGDVAYEVGLGLFRRMDVVVGCVDSRWARYCIQRLCLRAGKSWVDGGILELEGTVRVFRPGENCYACCLGEQGLEELRRRMPCSGVIRRQEEAHHAPTTPLIASVIGAVQAQEAIKLIVGVEPSRRMFYYEGEHLTTRLVDFQAWDEDCPLHEAWEPLGDLLTADGDRLAVNPELKVGTLVAHGALVLNDPFVDYVIHKERGVRTSLMLPAHRVAASMERHPDLRFEPFSRFDQHAYRVIDGDFPYPELTLGELGIPAADVLRLKTKSGTQYIAMVC